MAKRKVEWTLFDHFGLTINWRIDSKCTHLVAQLWHVWLPRHTPPVAMATNQVLLEGERAHFSKYFPIYRCFLVHPPLSHLLFFSKNLGSDEGVADPFTSSSVFGVRVSDFSFFSIFSPLLSSCSTTFFSFGAGRGEGGGAAETVSRLRGPSCGFGFFRWVGAQWFLPILRFFSVSLQSIL